MDFLLACITLLVGGTVAAAYVVGLIHLLGLTAGGIEALGSGASAALRGAQERVRLALAPRPASELTPAGPPAREGRELATPEGAP